MTDHEVIYRRLQRLNESVEVLRRLGRYSFDEFAANPERYGSSERFLQVAVEALLDMGAHVVATRELGSVVQYRDVPILLANSGFISEAQRDMWVRMIGFRNVLVHDYLDVDLELVHRILRENLDDIEELSKVFTRLL